MRWNSINPWNDKITEVSRETNRNAEEFAEDDARFRREIDINTLSSIIFLSC